MTRSSFSTLAAMAVALVGLSLTSHAQQGRPLQDPNHETTTKDVPGLTAATSLCAISDDPGYGTTTEKPIQVGGGPMYLASRETKYLGALRGPDGQGVHFKRNGSARSPDGTILDSYSLDYKGIDRAVTLYLDGYHWTAPPKAPVGWLCGADMNLEPPGPDPFVTQMQVRKIAFDLGQQPIEPISLDPDGSKSHGVIFDHVRLMALGARLASSSGKPLDPDQPPRQVIEARMVVVAFPMKCDGKDIVPDSVKVMNRDGNTPRVLATGKGDDVGKLVPGFDVPPGSVAVVYATPALTDGARSVVQYGEGCAGQPRELQLPARFDRGRIIRSVPGTTPPGVAVPPTGVQVHVQVFIAYDGTTLLPEYVSGPWELREAAIAAAKDWRVEAPRLNGAPLLGRSTLAITFRPR